MVDSSCKGIVVHRLEGEVGALELFRDALSGDGLLHELEVVVLSSVDQVGPEDGKSLESVVRLLEGIFPFLIKRLPLGVVEVVFNWRDSNDILNALLLGTLDC